MSIPNKMQSANRLQNALKSGKPTFGAWQMLPGANLSRAIARTPSIDWVCVDCEHGNLDDAAMHASVAAIAAVGRSPVVRVAESQHWMLKRALDAGAHGVIVPLLRSAADARAVVAACKFPPRGTRGLGSPLPMEKFSVVAPSREGEASSGSSSVESGGTVMLQEVSMAQYFREANDAIVVIVQIETAEALDDIDAIAAVPGVDVCFVGPHDLGNSIGHPVSEDGRFDAELEAAIETIRDAAKAAGKWTAIYSSSGVAAKAYAKQGFDMVTAVNDYAAIQKSFRAELAAATAMNTS